jgi:hypothetical protein
MTGMSLMSVARGRGERPVTYRNSRFRGATECWGFAPGGLRSSLAEVRWADIQFKMRIVSHLYANGGQC